MTEAKHETPAKKAAAETKEEKPKRSFWAAIRNMPVVGRVVKLPRQLLRISPFAGDIRPGRVSLISFGSGRPTLPFPHRGNYQEPIKILETFFWKADGESGAARHNRYMEIPLRSPILVTRDPRVIRAISAETGAGMGQFDRDTLPSRGIARATGEDSLLYANGALWKRQKKLATPPFARSNLFQPEQFRGFAETFGRTVRARLEVVHARIAEMGGPLRVALETEIKALMLEMLVNNFFGAEVPYEKIRERYVPALEAVIDYIVHDTVVNRMGIPLNWRPGLGKRVAEAKKSQAVFEELTDLVLAARKGCRGLWEEFKSDAPDEALRSNIRVFLAGALEATTSYASWALSHLARNHEAQEKVYEEVKNVSDYVPEALARAVYLDQVLNETLRLTPSLYFHPRRASADTWVELGSGEKFWIPMGTHILLDVWHANRHEDHWGVEATGFRADIFAPERWAKTSKHELRAGDLLHFGFGHGPRFCPGKSLGQLEVALVVGACIKLFKIKAVNQENAARAGVSTKPADGVLVEIFPRELARENSVKPEAPSAPAKCPFTGRSA
jgi:cytochrome P450